MLLHGFGKLESFQNFGVGELELLRSTKVILINERSGECWSLAKFDV